MDSSPLERKLAALQQLKRELAAAGSKFELETMRQELMSLDSAAVGPAPPGNSAVGSTTVTAAASAMQLGGDELHARRNSDFDPSDDDTPLVGPGSSRDPIIPLALPLPGSDPAESERSRSFWSAADDLTVFRERRQQKTYDAIVPLLQDPTRTVKSLKAHFSTRHSSIDSQTRRPSL